MNIEDYESFEITFPEIFNKQRDIKFLYEPESIEIFRNFDIDCYSDQEIFKNYCWRITEELAEALEDIENTSHFLEELIDGFNFVIELFLLYGKDFHSISKPNEYEAEKLKPQILNVIYQLGITSNLLKNRQWRRSQYMVDLHEFEPRLDKIWEEYIKIFRILGMNDKDIQELWSLKYQVNIFRIKTNY